MLVPETAFKMGLDGCRVEIKFCPGLHGLKWQLLLCFLATTCEAFFFPGLVPITYCEEGNPNSYCKVRSGGQKKALEGRGVEDSGWSQTHHLGMAPYFFLVLSSLRLFDPSFALSSKSILPLLWPCGLLRSSLPRDPLSLSLLPLTLQFHLSGQNLASSLSFSALLPSHLRLSPQVLLPSRHFPAALSSGDFPALILGYSLWLPWSSKMY